MSLWCRLFQGTLSRSALLGERPAPDSWSGRHLSGCPDCEEEWIAYRSLAWQLRGLESARPTAAFRAGVLARLSFSPMHPTAGRLLALAPVCVLVFALARMPQQSQPSSTLAAPNRTMVAVAPLTIPYEAEGTVSGPVLMPPAPPPARRSQHRRPRLETVRVEQEEAVSVPRGLHQAAQDTRLASLIRGEIRRLTLEAEPPVTEPAALPAPTPASLIEEGRVGEPFSSTEPPAMSRMAAVLAADTEKPDGFYMQVLAPKGVDLTVSITAAEPTPDLLH